VSFSCDSPTRYVACVGSGPSGAPRPRCTPGLAHQRGGDSTSDTASPRTALRAASGDDPPRMARPPRLEDDGDLHRLPALGARGRNDRARLPAARGERSGPIRGPKRADLSRSQMISPCLRAANLPRRTALGPFEGLVSLLARGGSTPLGRIADRAANAGLPLGGPRVPARRHRDSRAQYGPIYRGRSMLRRSPPMR